MPLRTRPTDSRYKTPQTVASIVQWARHNAQGASLMEREIVRTAVGFANQPSLEGLLRLLSGVDLPYLDKLRPHDALSTELFGPLRGPLVADLSSIAEGSVEAEVVRRCRAEASNVLLVPSYRDIGGAPVVEHHYRADDVRPMLAYATLLLLDPTRPYGAKLCRCKLTGCGDFFFERPHEKGGKPARNYCNHKHYELGQTERSAARVRAFREREKLAKARKHR